MISLPCCREVPDHPKALFRQAAVRAVLGDFDEAEEGYKYVGAGRTAVTMPCSTSSVLTLAPHCRRVAAVDPMLKDEMQREVARMRQREKAGAAKQKEQFNNFFAARKA